MDEVWDGMDDRDDGIYDLPGDSSTSIRVNGSSVSVDPGTSFVEVVKSTAINSGLGKFRVFLNGDEIKPSDSPESFSEGDKVDLRPYDVAGGV
jgi:hypothetical protein